MHVCICCHDDVIRTSLFPPEFLSPPSSILQPKPLNEDQEFETLWQAHEKSGWNNSKATASSAVEQKSTDHLFFNPEPPCILSTSFGGFSRLERHIEPTCIKHSVLNRNQKHQLLLANFYWNLSYTILKKNMHPGPCEWHMLWRHTLCQDTHFLFFAFLFRTITLTPWNSVAS